jgi:carboxylesterase type B
MVWIHGGGFFTGSGNGETDFYGPHYLMDKDIILVTINYRLGTFGTGHFNDPGTLFYRTYLRFLLYWVEGCAG